MTNTEETLLTLEIQNDIDLFNKLIGENLSPQTFQEKSPKPEES
jgi:hypothetical protein